MLYKGTGNLLSRKEKKYIAVIAVAEKSFFIWLSLLKNITYPDNKNGIIIAFSLEKRAQANIRNINIKIIFLLFFSQFLNKIIRFKKISVKKAQSKSALKLATFITSLCIGCSEKNNAEITPANLLPNKLLTNKNNNTTLKPCKIKFTKWYPAGFCPKTK
jgi:hypothetical protein